MPQEKFQSDALTISLNFYGLLLLDWNAPYCSYWTSMAASITLLSDQKIQLSFNHRHFRRQPAEDLAIALDRTGAIA